jgi:hypothetical protein
MTARYFFFENLRFLIIPCVQLDFGAFSFTFGLFVFLVCCHRSSASRDRAPRPLHALQIVGLVFVNVA